MKELRRESWLRFYWENKKHILKEIFEQNDRTTLGYSVFDSVFKNFKTFWINLYCTFINKRSSFKAKVEGFLIHLVYVISVFFSRIAFLATPKSSEYYHFEERLAGRHQSAEKVLFSDVKKAFSELYFHNDYVIDKRSLKIIEKLVKKVVKKNIK